MHTASFVLACLSLAACAAFAAEKSVLDFTLDSIDGKPYELKQHKGQVLLIVNVASECGNTPQYKGLEAMYEKYKDKGLTIIGVPANEFGHQEPGSNAEIKKFCTSTYDVKFPMMSKVVVKGEGICPLYKYLTTESAKKGAIGWNFAKFLVDRNGQVIDRFDPATGPEDPKLVAAVEKALEKK
ncbi:MAG TPA: glutathione peroxidase [Planctomycetota bacterium]|nr:glutathione peroxidase [Planctomycetota bacterium]